MGLFKTCPEQLKFSAILYDLHLISVAFTYHQTQEMKPHSKSSAMGLNCVTMEKKSCSCSVHPSLASSHCFRLSDLQKEI